MAREFSRTDRVAQQVHKEVASILQNEYKHRVGDMPLITVSEVEVSRDLAHAKIYVTIYNSTEEEGKAQVKQLKELKGFIRSILAKRLRMRSVPDLHFTSLKISRLSKVCAFQIWSHRPLLPMSQSATLMTNKSRSKWQDDVKAVILTA